MSTFLCFSCYDCERAAGRKARIYVLWHVCVRCFMYQERETPGRRRNKRGEPDTRRCVPKDDQLSRSGERCRFMDDKANARVYCQAGRTINRTVLWPARETQTSVDERPSTHVYGPPETASFCKIPPVSVFVAKEVSSRLLVIMESFVFARRTWICWVEELMNRIAVCRLCACQGKRAADEGTKACGPVQVHPRLRYAIEVVSARQIHRNLHLQEYRAVKYLRGEESPGCCVRGWEDP